MPIIQREERGVDVNLETGERRGNAAFLFDNDIGWREAVGLKAPDAPSWAQKLLDLEAEVLAEVQREDAEVGVEEDEEIVPFREASLGMRVLAKLRRAYLLKDRTKAARLFVRVRNYLVANIPNINRTKIRNHLIGLGMPAEEWDKIANRYDWLTDAGHITTMTAMQAIIDGDPALEDLKNEGI
jgi:hypothetical protein